MLLAVGAVSCPDPDVEFDAYIPITVYWPRSAALLDPPKYLRFRQGRNLLELKFHPKAGDLLELVLVSAPEARAVDETLGSVIGADEGVAPTIDPASANSADGACLTIAIYEDCLKLVLESEASVIRWIGSKLIAFGLTSDSVVSEIRIMLNPTQRSSVLESTRC